MEKRLAAAVVVACQKRIQNGPFFLQLSKIGFQPQLPGPGNVLLPAPVGYEGVPVIETTVAGTGVLRTFPAKQQAAAFQGTLGDGAALIACSAAAAGAVAAQAHGAQGAMEAAQGKAGFCTGKALHCVPSLRTTAPAPPGIPGFPPGYRGHNGFRCSRIPAKNRSVRPRSSG